MWEDPKANQDLFSDYLKEAKSDLFILPEMFSTGFTRDFTETAPHSSLLWLKEQALGHQTALYGSIAWQEDDRAYNRGIWMNPQGDYKVYDKKHLFSYGNEQLTFSAGTNILQTEYVGWKFRPLICYDLRFPVWSRNTAPFYDVLIYIASWPEARRDAWKTLLKARAIENQAYVIGVNRIGKDGYNLSYSGDSCVIDFKGNVLLDAQSEKGRFNTSLSHEELQAFRSKYPFLQDGDKFKL
ncbi:nitrilase-related carbon-nitrogen hydrolase [Leadbetterella byssophila]|uniref:nitrilase-related carbon-nitrogen hydrolase n=1 Tax=Leadbetterella byssophila TaxID=316068 RepID=UPI001E3F1F26